jgi:hypothetical protein
VNQTNQTVFPLPKRKRLQIHLTTSGFDQLIYFFNKNTSEIIPLINSTNRITINPEDDIGLLGVFDSSGTIATTINYLLTVTDEDLFDDDREERRGLAPIIIFVIVISSVIGFILLVVACYFMIKALRGSRKTLIRMNNEIQFKRGETF